MLGRSSSVSRRLGSGWLTYGRRGNLEHILVLYDTAHLALVVWWHTFGGMRVESARRVTKLIVKAALAGQHFILAQ